MHHFPIFIALEGRRVVLSGGGDAALAKLRLLLKTSARLVVHAPTPAPEIVDWARAGRLTLIRRPLAPGDALCAALFYAADEDATEDARTVALARADGALTNTVDNLAASQFITPAIVDRDPVTVAIGTEGTAPVLARAIKADIEALLPARLGVLARAAQGFRKRAEALAMGRARRAFWSDFFFAKGPAALAQDPSADLDRVLATHMTQHLRRDDARGRVTFAVIASPEADLLPLRTRDALHEADLVLHGPGVAPEILELARREATFGPLRPAEGLIEAAQSSAHVLSLAAAAPGPALQSALHRAGIDHCVIPGIAPLPTVTLLEESA